ncbi:MAG: hypothetical protein ACO1SV_25880 [Fimbriimonas sp.]
MQIEYTAEREEDRLTADEVYALRARLLGEASLPREVATVADLAAVSGRSPEEIWHHLDRMRAERAFEAYTKRPWRLQAGMIGVALVVAAAAYTLYGAMNPTAISDAEAEALLHRARELRKRQPKKIQYPIQSVVPLAEAPFPGFDISFRGVLTKTSVKPARVPGPVTVEMARQRLERAMQAAFEAARKAEVEAPPPPSPLKSTDQPWAIKPNRNAMVLNFGPEGRGQPFLIPIDPKSAKPEISRIAADYVRSMEASQQFGLREPDDPSILVIPPGFGLTVKVGDSTHGFSMGNSLALRPIDPAAVRARLDSVIRDAVRQAIRQTGSMPGAGTGGNSPPTDVVVSVAGPIRTYDITLPLREGGEFPIAADAFRAFEERLAAGLDEAVRQVREANTGKAKE